MMTTPAAKMMVTVAKNASAISALVVKTAAATSADAFASALPIFHP